jgi:hypothetical protein
MIQFINILDLKTILVWAFAGSTTIFTFLAIIAIATLAGRFRLPTSVFFVLLILFILLMSSSIGSMIGIYLLALLLAGIIVGYLIGRTFNR